MACYALEADGIFVYDLLMHFWDLYTPRTHGTRAVAALVELSTVLAQKTKLIYVRHVPHKV